LAAVADVLNVILSAVETKTFPTVNHHKKYQYVVLSDSDINLYLAPLKLLAVLAANTQVLNVILLVLFVEAPVIHQAEYQYVPQLDNHIPSLRASGRLLVVLAEVTDVLNTTLSVSVVLALDVHQHTYQYVVMSDNHTCVYLATLKLLAVFAANVSVEYVIIFAIALTDEIYHHIWYHLAATACHIVNQFRVFRLEYHQPK
jgi:hypothetical protein